MTNTRILLVGLEGSARPIPVEAQYRNLYMASALAERGHEVYVAMPISRSISKLPLFSKLLFKKRIDPRAHIQRKDYDVAIAPLELYPHDMQIDVPLVINMQAPVFTATLPEQSDVDEMDTYYFGKKLALTWQTLRHGDFFICATEQQRLFYLGLLHMAGRSNNLTVNKLANRMLVVMPGVPSDTAPKGENPYTALGIQDGEPILLWPSGLYSWYEPLCVAEAMPRILERHPRAHLVYAGANNPSAERLCTEHLSALRNFIARERLERHVHIMDWLPYDKRAGLYQHAVLGLCTYTPSFETELAWRSRIIDMLWGGLPTVVTGGDALSEMIDAYGAGRILSSHAPEHIAATLIDYLGDAHRLAQAKKGVEKLKAERLDWSTTIGPLAAFCDNPSFAPDRAVKRLDVAVHDHFNVQVRSGLRERIHMKIRNARKP